MYQGVCPYDDESKLSKSAALRPGHYDAAGSAPPGNVLAGPGCRPARKVHTKFERHSSASPSGTQPLRSPFCTPVHLIDGHLSSAAACRNSSAPRRPAEAAGRQVQSGLDMPLWIG